MLLAANFWAWTRTCTLLDCLEKLVKRVSEKLDTVVGQLVSDLVHGNGQLGDRFHQLVCPFQILRQRRSGVAMVAKSFERGGWERVDGVCANEFVNVQGVFVRGIFRAGAGPQDPLFLRAPGSQFLPAIRPEDPDKPLVGLLAIGDRDFAENAFELLALAIVFCIFQASSDDNIDGIIDPADEEASDTRDPADVAAVGCELLESGDVGFRNFLVNLLREEQRHIDIDAFADKLLEGGDALAGARNFDHHVLAAHVFPQPSRFLNCALRVAGEIGRDFQADISVASLSALVDGAENVGSVLNVANRQYLVASLGVEVGSRLQGLQQFGVVGAAGDRFLEDRWIRGDTTKSVLVDQALEFAAGDELAANVVQPDGLSEILELFEWIGGF